MDGRIAAACLILVPSLAWAAGAGVVGENLLWLALILMSARLFAPLAQRIGFPAVLGELLLGVALGNLGLVGIDYFVQIPRDPIIAFLAELGVIVLLLQIGLETRLADLIKVGGQASAVGVFGIAAPFLLGAFVVGPWLLPGLDSNAYLFLGATLSATSVGITGRVFRDLGRLGSPAARIVLGAAVIDDVLGLVILAVVSSLVQARQVSVGEVSWIIAKAVLFLGGSIWLGRLVAPHSARWLARIDAGPSMLFAQVLATGLFLAWLAHAIGLAPIIGAFAAGLILHPTPQRKEIERSATQLGYFFVPIFFASVGASVELRALASGEALLAAMPGTRRVGSKPFAVEGQHETTGEWEAPRAVACVSEDLEALLAFYDCPPEHWKCVRTTNVIERCFVEVRRRIRPMCAFTTRSSAERILYSVCCRMNTYWDRHPLKPFTQNS